MPLLPPYIDLPEPSNPEWKIVNSFRNWPPIGIGPFIRKGIKISTLLKRFGKLPPISEGDLWGH